jgi:hypothetical protein
MNMRILSRRALLRGGAGAVVALPWLEAMVKNAAQAQALSPKRFMIGFCGVSTGGPNFFIPNATGANYDTKRAIAPLAPVKDQVSIVTGLAIPGQGAGSWGGGSVWHASSVGPLLSGVSSPDNGNPVPRGPTADQRVADLLAGNARFRSLELRVQPEVYREHNGRWGIISYNRNAQGTLQPNEPQSSPKLAYDALFTGFTPPDNTGGTAPDPAEAQKLLQDRSVLDLVKEQSQTLLGRLSMPDRQRLERHFEEIRALELRLGSAVQGSGAGCAALTRPGDDPARNTATYEAYGTSRVVGYSGENERAPIMTSLMHMAFACDLTRTMTMAYTFAQSFIDSQALLGHPDRQDLHEIGHGDNHEQGADVVAWHVKHFADLVALLKNTPEGNGTALDNTVLVLLFEGGNEEVTQGGDPHSGDNTMCLIAGGAGGLKRGVHVSAPGKHPCNALVSAMQAVGLQAGEHGELQGPIAGLV